jgi:SAM-dependent methyltransferase
VGAQGQAAAPFEPQVGQAGKDVVWVPTSPELLTLMLDMAKVTPADYVVDLGSGDGRNIIAAAKRGARGLGVEYNPDMVELSRRLAREAAVADLASFVQGDMYEADFQKATVLALFLLPQNLERLTEKFLALKPGTRLVLNTFGIPGWTADETVRLETGGCTSWCTSLLYIVPARVAGRWRLPQGELTLVQQFQTLTGSLQNGATSTPLTDGHLRGEQIAFTIGGIAYTGTVDGDRIEGTAAGQRWVATKIGN